MGDLGKKGFFDNIMDAVNDNPVANVLGFGLAGFSAWINGLAARVGKAYGDLEVGPVGQPEGDGPITLP